MNQQFNQLPEVVKAHTEFLIIDKNLYNIRQNVEQFVVDIWNHGNSNQEGTVKNATHPSIRAHIDAFKNEIWTYRNDRSRYIYNEQRLTLMLSNRADKVRTQLGITNLDNLPLLPQGQTLQSLIDFYNSNSLNNTTQQKIIILSNALENAKRILRKDKERVDFEELRRARQELDILTQKKENSPEAAQAYKAVNKEDEITNCIKELAKQIWDYLNESAKKIEKDPSSQESIEELEKRGYNKGTEVYETFWMLRSIIKEFNKSRLNWEKELNIYPYVKQEQTNSIFADVDWRNEDVKTEIIDFYFNFDKDFSEKFGNDEWQIYYTLAHELSHFQLLITEYKDWIPRFQNDHGRIFWENFLLVDNSTFSYVISCLLPEKQRKLKEFANPTIPKKSTNPSSIFFSSSWSPDWETRKILTKEIKEQSSILKEWNYVWQTLHKIIDDSMNEDPKNWKDYSELGKHWFVTQRELKGDQIKDGQAKETRINIHFNRDTMPKAAQTLIYSAFREDNGWKRNG